MFFLHAFETVASRLIFIAHLDSRFGARHAAIFFFFFHRCRYTRADGNVSISDARSIFWNAAIRMGKVRASEKANQTVICNQLKANKPGADWTTVAGVRRENGNNNSGSLTAVYGLFLWEHTTSPLRRAVGPTGLLSDCCWILHRTFPTLHVGCTLDVGLIQALFSNFPSLFV